MTVEQRTHHHPDRRDGADLDPADRKRINAAALIEVRKLWWQMRRQGVRLPAQRNIIVIDGRQQ